jgi:hypothetical protein
MATAKKAQGNFLTQKAGPLPRWGWVAAAVGTFVVYRYIKAREASSAATTSTATTGGSLIPNDIGLPAASTTTGAGSFSSIAEWQQAALTFLTGNGLDANDALNAISAYSNGNCVSQAAYNALGAALTSSSVGLPPGLSAGTLSVCPNYSNEIQLPTGYQQGPGETSVTSSTGQSIFTPILNSQDLAALTSAGDTIYYQPSPGVFVKAPASTTGVPIFSLASGTGA